MINRATDELFMYIELIIKTTAECKPDAVFIECDKMIGVYLICFVLLLLFFAAIYERTTPMYKASRQLQGPGRMFPLIGNIYQLLVYTQSKRKPPTITCAMC